MTYGKVSDTGALTVAPKKIKVAGRTIMSPRASDYIAAGYLPIDSTTSIPEGYKWADQWEEKDGKIVKKYVPIPQEQIEYEASHAIVMMTKEEEEQFQNMTETLENARKSVESAQEEAENARADAESARAEATAAVEAKEEAEAALADVSEVVAKIEEVFG